MQTPSSILQLAAESSHPAAGQRLFRWIAPFRDPGLCLSFDPRMRCACRPHGLSLFDSFESVPWSSPSHNTNPKGRCRRSHPCYEHSGMDFNREEVGGETLDLRGRREADASRDGADKILRRQGLDQVSQHAQTVELDERT